jgi:hypothetical protein
MYFDRCLKKIAKNLKKTPKHKKKEKQPNPQKLTKLFEKF